MHGLGQGGILIGGRHHRRPRHRDAGDQDGGGGGRNPGGLAAGWQPQRQRIRNERRQGNQLQTPGTAVAVVGGVQRGAQLLHATAQAGAHRAPRDLQLSSDLRR